MKKIISIMIIALMTLGLVACADVSHNNTTSKEQNDSLARPEIQSDTISLEGYDTFAASNNRIAFSSARFIESFLCVFSFNLFLIIVLE